MMGTRPLYGRQNNSWARRAALLISVAFVVVFSFGVLMTWPRQDEEVDYIFIDGGPFLEEEPLVQSTVQGSTTESDITASFDEPMISRKAEKNVFAIVLCKASREERQSYMKKYNDLNFGEQIEQAFIAIKSAVILSTETVRFVLISNEKETFNILKSMINLHLPSEVKERVSFTYSEIWYPAEMKHLKSVYKPCATANIFLSSLIPYDSVIYLDSDVIFMKPPEQLWAEFSKFGPNQLAGMAPRGYVPKLKLGMYHKSPIGRKIQSNPYYGKTGVNSGVILWNLTRLGQFPGGWETAMSNITQDYEDRLYIGSQTIVNIFFNQNPSLLYELECHWNFQPSYCSSNITCSATNEYGLGIIHGSGMLFYNLKMFETRALFEAWKAYDLEYPLYDFYSEYKKSKTYLEDILKTTRRCSSFDILVQEFVEGNYF